MVDTEFSKWEVGLQQIGYLYYVICWFGRKYRFLHFGIHSVASSDKYVTIYQFEQMPKQGRTVDVHTLAKVLKQIIYIKVMMLFGKIQYG